MRNVYRNTAVLPLLTGVPNPGLKHHNSLTVARGIAEIILGNVLAFAKQQSRFMFLCSFTLNFNLHVHVCLVKYL